MAQRVEHHPLDAAFAALLANGLDGAGEALRILVDEASKIERVHYLNAQPHERTADRTDDANGFKPKTVMTRVGEQPLTYPRRAAVASTPERWRRARAPSRHSTSHWPRCLCRASPPARGSRCFKRCWGRRCRFLRRR